MEKTMTRYMKPIGPKEQSTKVADLQTLDSNALADNLQRLDSYKILELNWNGNGAEPFGMAFINRVKNIVSGLQIQPQIFPTGRNSIQLEYDKPNGDSIELEMYPDGLIESVKFLQSGTIEDNLTEIDLNTFIKAFHAD